MSFAHFLKDSLQASGFSQSAFSKATGSPQAFISQILLKKRTPPLDRIDSWADALKLRGKQRERFELLAHLAHCPEVIEREFLRQEGELEYLRKAVADLKADKPKKS